MSTVEAADPWDLAALTPVQTGARYRYKRDDLYAPRGEGGVNGTKLRQLVWLVEGAVARGARGLLTAASVRSPQLCMTAVVGARYGLPVVCVVGATNPVTAVRHTSVALAVEAGAELAFTPVAYNPALQRAATAMAPSLPGFYRVEYGITTPPTASPAEVEAFHALGARQTANVPPDVPVIAMTAGSCNSAVSVLYGLALARPPSLRRVVLVGVGPQRLGFIRDRLRLIRDVAGVDVLALLRPRFTDHRTREAGWGRSGPVEVDHHDLHARGVVTYADRVPWTEDGIVFHPTYEGKLMRYLARRWRPAERDGWLVWVVGAEASR